MDYPTSTQRLRWLFASQEALDIEREKARHKVLDRLPGASTSSGTTTITLEEEKRLISYYAHTLIKLSKTMKLPDKVMSSACTFLRRFYIRNSCLEYDPQGIVLTCLYVAAKVEDCYVSAEHIHNVGGISEDLILKSELPLLQGLEFDLQVHPIHKALEGFLSIREEQGSATGDATKDIWEKSKKRIEQFLLTDAIMLFTPGQLAVKAADHAAPAYQDDPTLAEVLTKIDVYTNELSKMDDVDVKEIDRKLKSFFSKKKKRKHADVID